MPQVSVAVEPVEALDTVGAGDSYMGAFLVSLREKAVLASVSSIVRTRPAIIWRAVAVSCVCMRACLRLRHRVGWLR